MWSRVVTSTSATIWILIPTGGSSPNLMYSSSGAFSVESGGYVDNYNWLIDNSCGWKIIYYSSAIDTIGDSVLYIEANGGSYITDYLSTYSYGREGLTLRTSTISIIVHIMLKWMALYLVIGT